MIQYKVQVLLIWSEAGYVSRDLKAFPFWNCSYLISYSMVSQNSSAIVDESISRESARILLMHQDYKSDREPFGPVTAPGSGKYHLRLSSILCIIDRSQEFFKAEHRFSDCD